MCQLDRLHQLKDQILRIARSHNAERIFVFGSCARKEETPNSDVDFIAYFKEHATLFDHAGLELDLAELLGCSVDVVTWRRAQKDDAFGKNVRREMVELC
jgi:predicted nucleotidyltransferase